MGEGSPGRYLIPRKYYFAAHRTGAGAKRLCSGDGVVMAAETMETNPRNRLFGRDGRCFYDMHKRGHRPAALPILQSNNGRQTQTIGD